MAALPDRTVPIVQATPSSATQATRNQATPVEPNKKEAPAFHFQRFPTSGERKKSNNDLDTRVNYFVVKMPLGNHVKSHDIHFAPLAGGRAIKNRAFKKELIRELLQQPGFLAHAQGLATDYNSTLISAPNFQLPAAHHHTSFVQAAPPSPASAPVPCYQVAMSAQVGTPARNFDIHITAPRILLKQDLYNFIEGRNQNDNSQWLNALNILTRKNAAGSNVKVGSDRFFPLAPSPTLHHGLHARSGFFASIRPVKDNIVLNLHGVSTGFVDSQALHLFPAEFYNAPQYYTRPPLQLRRVDPQFKAIVRGLRVRLLYDPPTLPDRVPSPMLTVPRDGGKIKRINGFGDSAVVQTFNHSTYGRISVRDYFNTHVLAGNQRLQYPDLLVCNLGTRDEPNYVPSELLHIVADQPYSSQLPEGAMSRMVSVSQRPPAANVSLIEGAFANNRMFDQATLRRSGMVVTPTMMTAKSRLLLIPDLSYRGSVEAGGPADSLLRKGRWDLRGKSFKNSGTMGDFGVFEIGQHRTDMNAYRSLARALTTCGIANQQQQPHRVTNRFVASGYLPADLSAALARFPSKPLYLLVVLPSNGSEAYEFLKWWADTQVGVHTICITPGKLGDLVKPPFQANLALKFNVKAGGTNHTADKDTLERLAHGSSTMVVGADVTHPGPGSVPHCPSIAAVVASTDKIAVKFPGSMHLQTCKQEMIADLAQMMGERLAVWYAANSQKLPANILFYRDGVSESQFAAVRDDELAKIRHGCEKYGVSVNCPQYRPKITVVVCGKRHHTRFYPTKKMLKEKQWASNSMVDTNGNWKAGLMVDDPLIRNPHHFDFYLQSHAALRGTARPCHYFVIENGMGLTPEKLQQITFDLCWTFARSLTPISQASPAYYADLLAERGRCYLAPFLKAGHRDRGAVERGLYHGLAINNHTTMQQKDQLVLDRIKNGWTPPGSPNTQHWVGTAQRANPQHPNLGDTMFYI